MHPRALLSTLLIVVPALAQGGILSLSPTSVNAGSGAFTLTVNGLGFASGNVLQWDGTNLPTTFISSTQLTASVTAAQVLIGGTHSIRNKVNVTFNNFSNTVPFNVNNPLPVLSSISPASVAAGAATFTLTATGTGFNQSSVIRWGGTPLTTTFVSPTSLTASIAASLVATGSATPVTVNNPSPAGGTTAPLTFNVINPSPTLTSISPTNQNAGAGFTLTANGTNFNAATTIRLNGGTVPTTLVSATQVTASISAALLAVPVTYAVTANNPAPGGGETNAINLNIVNPNPGITTISPFVVVGGGSAQSLVFNGNGFVAQSVVLAGGFVLSPDSFSPTQLTVTIPQNLLHSTTVLPLSVSTPPPGGGTSNANLLVTGPVIASVAPVSVPVLFPASAPVTLTVNGASFVAGDVIRLNGAPRATTFVSSNVLTCTVEGTLPLAQQLGGFAVSVTHGNLVSNAVGVTVGAPGFPNNAGTVTVGPVPPTPGQLFDIRVEVPINTVPAPLPSVPLTLIADTAAPAPFILSPVFGFNLAVGPGAGSPVIICDGLGIFGPAITTGATTHFEDLSTFGVITPPRGVFRTSGLALPPLGITVSLMAVYANPSTPTGYNATHVSGPYSF